MDLKCCDQFMPCSHFWYFISKIQQILGIIVKIFFLKLSKNFVMLIETRHRFCYVDCNWLQICYVDWNLSQNLLCWPQLVTYFVMLIAAGHKFVKLIETGHKFCLLIETGHKFCYVDWNQSHILLCWLKLVTNFVTFMKLVTDFIMLIETDFVTMVICRFYIDII